MTAKRFTGLKESKDRKRRTTRPMVECCLPVDYAVLLTVTSRFSYGAGDFVCSEYEKRKLG